MTGHSMLGMFTPSVIYYVYVYTLRWFWLGVIGMHIGASSIHGVCRSQIKGQGLFGKFVKDNDFGGHFWTFLELLLAPIGSNTCFPVGACMCLGPRFGPP